MISRALEDLQIAYIAELRESKEAAERWWTQLNERYAKNELTTDPNVLWPMGPVSHPWVIATYRKYFFECAKLNQAVGKTTSTPVDPGHEDSWGSDDAAQPAETVEPKTFVLDLLAGGDTNDLYEFLLSLVFVPIGLKGDELV